MATASISTIGRAVQDRLPEGKMTWKKMMRHAGEKFTPDNQVGYFKVAPYSFLSGCALISKISRWRRLSNSTRKSRAGSRSKMPTNMASKLLKVVYRKCCVDRLLFQNICRLNRIPYLSLLDVKEKYTRHAGVSINEADFMRFVRSPRSSSRAKQDGILPHIFAVLGVVCGADTKAKI